MIPGSWSWSRLRFSADGCRRGAHCHGSSGSCGSAFTRASRTATGSEDIREKVGGPGGNWLGCHQQYQHVVLLQHPTCHLSQTHWSEKHTDSSKIQIQDSDYLKPPHLRVTLSIHPPPNPHSPLPPSADKKLLAPLPPSPSSPPSPPSPTSF